MERETWGDKWGSHKERGRNKVGETRGRGPLRVRADQKNRGRREEQGEEKSRRRVTKGREKGGLMIVDIGREEANEPGQVRERDVKRNQIPCLNACVP